MERIIREYFSVHITDDELLDYYRGQASQVVVRTESNRTLQFRVMHLRRFVTPTGIRGRFVISYDSHGRFVDIQRCSFRRSNAAGGQKSAHHLKSGEDESNQAGTTPGLDITG